MAVGRTKLMRELEGRLVEAKRELRCLAFEVLPFLKVLVNVAGANHAARVIPMVLTSAPGRGKPLVALCVDEYRNNVPRDEVERWALSLRWGAT
jgi:hypothetical protein